MTPVLSSTICFARHRRTDRQSQTVSSDVHLVSTCKLVCRGVVSGRDDFISRIMRSLFGGGWMLRRAARCPWHIAQGWPKKWFGKIIGYTLKKNVLAIMYFVLTEITTYRISRKYVGIFLGGEGVPVFRRVNKNCEKRILSSVISVCPYRTTLLPLDGFSWNLIFE